MIGIPSTRPATPTSRDPPFRPRQRIVGTTAVDWALFVGPVDRAGLERTWVAVRMLYPSLERRGQLAASDDHGQDRRPSQALKVKKSAGVLDYLKNHSYLDTRRISN